MDIPSRVPQAGVGILFCEDETRPGRLVVHSLVSNGPAERCRLIKVGDLLTRIDGHEMSGILTGNEPQIPGPHGSRVSFSFEHFDDINGAFEYTVELRRLAEFYPDKLVANMKARSSLLSTEKPTHPAQPQSTIDSTYVDFATEQYNYAIKTSTARSATMEERERSTVFDQPALWKDGFTYLADDTWLTREGVEAALRPSKSKNTTNHDQLSQFHWQTPQAPHNEITLRASMGWNSSQSEILANNGAGPSSHSGEGWIKERQDMTAIIKRLEAGCSEMQQRIADLRASNSSTDPDFTIETETLENRLMDLQARKATGDAQKRRLAQEIVRLREELQKKNSENDAERQVHLHDELSALQQETLQLEKELAGLIIKGRG